MIEFLLAFAYTLVFLGYVISPWVMPLGVIGVVLMWRKHHEERQY